MSLNKHLKQLHIHIFFFTDVSKTDSDHAVPSSQVKKEQTSQKKILDAGRTSSFEEQTRFVVVVVIVLQYAMIHTELKWY